MKPTQRLLPILMLAATALVSAPSLPAQDPYHHPFTHREPTGFNGRIAALTRPAIVHAVQPVKIVLPSHGRVTFYQGSPHNPVVQSAPTQPGMVPGFTYRMRVSDMPEFPGVELFPTVELLDRLHPPQGFELEFPVPIELTEEEIEVALQDRMLTKVVYLEQPDLARPIEQAAGILTTDMAPNVNLLKAADLRGRPMAIIRLGGRIPDPNSPTDEFFCRSPIYFLGPPAPGSAPADMQTMPADTGN